MPIDIGSIAAAVSSLKAAGEIVKGLLNAQTMAEVRRGTAELQSGLIAAQHAIFEANATQATLVERIRELEKEIADKEAWGAEKQRYKLANPYSGVTVYAVTKVMSNGEPPHYVCANCFQGGKLAMLATSTSKEGWLCFVCGACKFTAQTRSRRGLGPAKYAEDVTPED